MIVMRVTDEFLGMTGEEIYLSLCGNGSGLGVDGLKRRYRSGLRRARGGGQVDWLILTCAAAGFAGENLWVGYVVLVCLSVLFGAVFFVVMWSGAGNLPVYQSMVSLVAAVIGRAW